MLERMLILNKFALSVLRLLSPKYIGIWGDDREDVHVVELRKSKHKMPISGREYEDVRIKYITLDGRFFKLPDTVFYKFYGRKV